MNEESVYKWFKLLLNFLLLIVAILGVLTVVHMDEWLPQQPEIRMFNSDYGFSCTIGNADVDTAREYAQICYEFIGEQTVVRE